MRRILGEYPDPADPSGGVVQRAFGMYRGICRTHLFVGIAVPQLIRKLFGTTKPLLMIPACFLGGSVFCLFCDLLARKWMAPTELSISTVTAIFEHR